MGSIINPIYKKEILTELRGIKFPIILLIYNGFLLMIATVLYKTVIGEDILEKLSYYIDSSDVYGILMIVEYAFILIVVPIYSASRISKEYENKTIQLLMLTDTKHIKIIWAKLCAVVTIMFLFVVSSTPIFIAFLHKEGMDIKVFLKYILIVSITSMYIGAIGIFISTMFKKTFPAIINTYLIVVLIVTGSYYVIKLEPNAIFINPVFTMLKLVSEVTDSVGYIDKSIMNVINKREYFESNWLVISVFVQAITSIIIIYATSSILRLNKYGKKIKSLPQD